MDKQPLQGKLLRFAQHLSAGMSQRKAFVAAGYKDDKPNANKAAKDPRVIAYLAAHGLPVVPSPPPALPVWTPPPALPALRSEPAEPFDAIAEAEVAVANARDNPRAHLAALRVLASLHRFAGQAARKGAGGAARPVARSGDLGGGADGSLLYDPRCNAFLDAAERQDAPEPAEWGQFLDAAGLPPDTPWIAGTAPIESERVHDALDHRREVVLARISESLEE